MFLQSKPYINFRLLFQRYKSEIYKTNLHFTENGRLAIKELALDIGLKKKDKILVPGFICFSAIEDLLKLGLIPIYYDIDQDLKLNWEKIRIHLDKHEFIRSILIVNYFGFIDSNKSIILDLCSKNNLKVIDDYCHSFLSYYLSNSYNIDLHSENVAFNLNKLVRVKCGIYIKKKSKQINSYKLTNYSITNIIFHIISILFEKLNYKFSLLNIYSENFKPFKKKIAKLEKKMKRFGSDTNICISNYIRKTLDDINYLQDIKSTRLSNYKYLYNLLKGLGINPIQKIEDDYSVPQTLAIFDNKGELNEYLRNNGIGSYLWPGEELPSFNSHEAKDLKNSISINGKVVCLPIHHSLQKKDLKMIVNKIKNFYF